MAYQIDGIEIIIRLESEAKKRLNNTGLTKVFCERDHGGDLIEVEAVRMSGRTRHRFFVNGALTTRSAVHNRPLYDARF